MDHWVLLVLVIIIIYLVVVSSGYSLTRSSDVHSGCAGASDAGASSATTSASSEASAPPTGGADSNREALAQRMIAEGIAGASNDACIGDMDDDIADYSEIAMRQTVDARVIESNREFVADRLGNPQTWTGATYSPDRHDTYDAIPWQGLSRPSQVPVDSPTQLPDIDITRNPIGRKFTWKSSETE